MKAKRDSTKKGVGEGHRRKDREMLGTGDIPPNSARIWSRCRTLGEPPYIVSGFRLLELAMADRVEADAVGHRD
jgi:hypothetical protein